MSELKVVGQSVKRLDAVSKVTGTAEFVHDLEIQGMLYGKILRSPVTHAKILNIDTSKAEKLPGVKGVVTGQDIPDRQYGIVPMAKDEYALARDKVRYIGDDVAAVCAIDPEIAEHAVGRPRQALDVNQQDMRVFIWPEGSPDIADE